MIGVSDLMRNWGWLIALVLAGGIGGFVVGMRNPGFRLAVDRRILRLPVVGRLTRDLHGARMARTLSTMITAGLPVLDITYRNDLGVPADPTGRLYRLSAATGKLELLLGNIPSPNGLVLNKAESALFLAVTRANAIWKIVILPDGSIAKVSTWIQMGGGNGPDGMAIDENDNIAVCHVGFGAVWLFSARGEPMLRIDSPKGEMTTNCAYGGRDNRTLFFTESRTGSILCAEMPVPGRAMYSHAD